MLGHHQQELRTFTGESDDDVEDWLAHYQRVSKYNRWDPTVKIINVAFSLTGTALLWLGNQEDALTNYAWFVDEITKCFVDSLVKKKGDEQSFPQRLQVPGDMCMKYIEEVVRLCRLVN